LRSYKAIAICFSLTISRGRLPLQPRREGGRERFHPSEGLSLLIQQIPLYLKELGLDRGYIFRPLQIASMEDMSVSSSMI
jgi:hypothetical protein